MTNLPTIEEIALDTGILMKLPLEALDAIMDAASEYAGRGSLVKRACAAVVENRFATAIAGQYQAEQKDTGTVRVDAGDYTVIADRPKKVDWEQSQLADAAARIQAAGDNPGEYLDISYSVPERKYTAWPQYLRDQFSGARTVKPGSITIKLAKKEAA